MFLFSMDLVHLAAFRTFFKTAANAFRSSFVCVITVLSVKHSVTLSAINIRRHEGGKIRASFVCSSATGTVLAATIMFLARLIVVGFLAVMAIIASV